MLGRGWLTECGMGALLLLAVITSGVAAFQVRGLLRRRNEPASPDERRVARVWPLMTLAIALVFWLLLAAVWLFRGIGSGPSASWWR